MANISLQNSVDGVFDILNSIFAMQTQCDVAVLDLRARWNTLQSQYGSVFSTSEWALVVAAAEAAVVSSEESASSLSLALQAMAEQAVIAKVDEAVNLVSADLGSALAELTSQMVERSESILLPAVTLTVAADGGNTGDMFIVGTKRTLKGVTNAQILAEVITITASLASGATTPSLLITSDAASTGLSPNGFGGSALNGYLGFYTINTGLIGSGGLNSFTTSSSTLPGSWIANVGTLGTAVLSGQPQSDTITVTGTPTSGTFRVTCATSSLGTQSTGNLAFDASAATIAAAIAAMSGFSKVSVTSTGSTPNFTHTIKFYGMREAVTTAVVNSTNTGTYTVATPTAYADPSLGSSPIVLVSDGSTLVSASHLLTHLLPRTAYAVNAWLAVNTAAASGVVEISLTNGVGGTILQDDAGNDLKFTVNATDLTTSFQAAAKLTSGTPIFMTPTVLPASVYLRIRASTTLPNTRKVYIENPIVGLATQLYTGGPFVGVFAGPTGAKDGDIWTITNTNDYAGATSFGMERNFAMRERGLYIPHVASPTVDDAVPVDPGPGYCLYVWEDGTAQWNLVENACNVGFTPDGIGSPGSVDGEFRTIPCI